MALNAPVPPIATGSSTSIQPSELTLRRLQSIADTVDSTDDLTESPTALPVFPVQDGDNVVLEVEEELSEQQLRELYDTEEIDRFLNLFSAYVTEVRLPDQTDPIKSRVNLASASSVTVNDMKDAELEEGDWIPVHGEDVPPPAQVELSPPPPSKCFSEWIAHRYILPNLPSAPPPPPEFTFGRLRITSQRLYLAVEPAYKPFFANLSRLATWKHRKESSAYCLIFWALWWYNLLLPALFLRILYALFRRKLFQYPTVEELRQRRKEVARANVFGEAVQARLTPSSPFGLTEIWRIFRVFNKPKVDKAKSMVKEKGKNKSKDKGKSKDSDSIKLDEETKSKPVGPGSGDTGTVLDDPHESKQEVDGKRAMLQTIGDIADIHERVKNIFIWRHPKASYTYGGVIFFLFLVTLLLPAKYIAKLSYAVAGVFFWHITPVLASLPGSDRARLPPAFNDVPTDADYAMDLISQRVALGLDVTSTEQRAKRRKPRNVQVGGADAAIKEEGDKQVDWRKWSDRAALGKAWAEDSKRLFTGNEWRRTGTWPPANPLMPMPTLLHSMPTPHIETYTFPAQHTSAPGLITLTPTILYFTPLMSPTAKVTIPFAQLRGVKKTGLLKGLSLRWADEQSDGNLIEKEEKFMWVGDRDELFARLIGPDGRRWLKV